MSTTSELLELIHVLKLVYTKISPVEEVGPILDEIADIIKQHGERDKIAKQLADMTAQRDELIRLVPRNCGTCINWNKSNVIPYGCKIGGCSSLKYRENWQWRGTPKATTP